MRLHLGQQILGRSPYWVLLEDAPLAISQDDQGASDGRRARSLATNGQRMGTGMAAGVVGLGIGEGEARGERGWGRANGLSAARRGLILSGEGKRVHTKIRHSQIRLQVAPSCCQTYIMTSFK